MSQQPIGLKEAIEALRSELSDSILAAQQEQIRFEVGQIDLEFQVEVERTREGLGGIRFWVVELGGKTGGKDSNTHKVTIPLKPVNRAGGPILTGAGSEAPE